MAFQRCGPLNLGARDQGDVELCSYCVQLISASKKKKKKRKKPQEENWPQVACSFPAPEMITEYSSAKGHSGTYRGKPLRFKPSVDTTSCVALGES